jgi:hypothetical protein
MKSRTTYPTVITDSLINTACLCLTRSDQKEMGIQPLPEKFDVVNLRDRESCFVIHKGRKSRLYRSEVSMLLSVERPGRTIKSIDCRATRKGSTLQANIHTPLKLSVPVMQGNHTTGSLATQRTLKNWVKPRFSSDNDARGVYSTSCQTTTYPTTT